MYVWTSCLCILTKSPAIPQQLYKPASSGLSAIITRFVSDSWASCIRSCPDTRAHATVANNVTVWWAELIVCGRAVMHNARPSLFIFAVLSAVLRSGFRDTRTEQNRQSTLTLSWLKLFTDWLKRPEDEVSKVRSVHKSYWKQRKLKVLPSPIFSNFSYFCMICLLYNGNSTTGKSLA